MAMHKGKMKKKGMARGGAMKKKGYEVAKGMEVELKCPWERP